MRVHGTERMEEVTSYASYELQVTSYKLQVTQVTSDELQVTHTERMDWEWPSYFRTTSCGMREMREAEPGVLGLESDPTDL